MSRLQHREPEAMADVYDRFGRQAYSVILAIVRDSFAAEDIVQETFLSLWNRAHTFEASRGSLGSWLIVMARNRAIDHVRSLNSRMNRNAFELNVRDHPSLIVYIDRDVLNSNHAQIIRCALSKLTANQQKVIELAYYEGFSQSEMAAHMAEPLGTIKTWVRSALRHLRNELVSTGIK